MKELDDLKEENLKLKYKHTISSKLLNIVQKVNPTLQNDD